MERNEVKNILEALLFVSDRPITLKEIKNVLEEDYANIDEIENILNELKSDFETSNKPYEIKFIAEGWTFAAKADYSPWIKKLYKRKFVFKLSPSALETLAIIAYKQPVTKGNIEDIRGIDSGGVVNTLLERKLIKIVGVKEALGRPSLYGTTQEFMRHFGLAHLNDLPLLKEEPQEEKDFSDEYGNIEEDSSLFENEEQTDNADDIKENLTKTQLTETKSDSPAEEDIKE